MSAARSEAPVRCVVFDIDDTLYLERDYVRSGFAAVGVWLEAELGVQGFSAQAWRLFEQGARGNTFDLALGEVGVAAGGDLIPRLVEVYRSHRPEIRLLDDARRCLDELHGLVPMAAITDGPVASQRAKVEALGLARWLEPIILTAELGPGFGKPHPRAFREVERAHGLSGASLVYVADNPAKDFAAPRQLGWQTLRLRRSCALHQARPANSDVDAELSDLEDMARLMNLVHPC